VSLFVPPYKKLMQSRTEIDNLQQQINEQHTLLARQTREVSLLKTDVSYLEMIARDRLRSDEGRRNNFSVWKPRARRQNPSLPRASRRRGARRGDACSEPGL
jgi:hypothetical protein